MKNLPDSLHNSQLVFQGVRFDVRTVELPGNVRRDVVIHPGAVIILPILTPQTIIMIRNERFAVGETLWELPAGTLEPNEIPEDTAQRELTEETGYSAKKITHLTTFYTSPGICDEKMYAYAATELTLFTQNLDPSEKISVEEVSWKDAVKMVREGIIHDGKTIATLLFYKEFIYT